MKYVIGGAAYKLLLLESAEDRHALPEASVAYKELMAAKAVGSMFSTDLSEASKVYLLDMAQSILDDSELYPYGTPRAVRAFIKRMNES